MDKLRPCPFCGGLAKIVLCDDEGNLHNEEIAKRMRTLVLDHCPEFRGLMAPPCAFMDECPEMEPCKEGQG